MNSKSKPIILMMVAVFATGLGAGCDQRPRIAAGHDVPRTSRTVDESRTVDRMSRSPSIVRESIDPRCFSPSQDENTQVIACPRERQLAIAAE